jgi:hypothetical protein
MIVPDETWLSTAKLLLRRRHGDVAFERLDIDKALRDAAVFLDLSIEPEYLRIAIDALEEKLIVTVGLPTVLSDKDASSHVPWYFGERLTSRRFFDRYKEFMIVDQGWSRSTVDRLDESTDLVMEQLEDPTRDGPWDRRGLVVGHVQSGKTANYAGLANKAIDAGYKLIIVLAGMHNALRQQTQRRMDRDVLGYDTTPMQKGRGFTPLGVYHFDRNLQADHLTTQAANGDFNRAFADNLGAGVQQRPVLLVVKKNARILENLNDWVRDRLKPRKDTETRPLLVIDDEADQASVDTGAQIFDDDETPDVDYEPKRINGQIRRLLAAFARSAYVAYTATPFANVLIHDAAEADGYGRDLFPRSFIVNLPAPSNYVGPALVFGTETDDGLAAEPLDFVRAVDQDEEGWIAAGHKKSFVPRYREDQRIPPSLEAAILAFVLACAARLARGQTKAHNSMLVHVSRFKDVHQQVFGQVDAFLTTVQRQLRYRTGKADLLARLEGLWRDDFVPFSADLRAELIGRGLPETAWADVEPLLSEAADRIAIRVVNSEMREALDYDAHPGGLNLIAIGGDKLSRGLTLEGLTVSYFLRASKMYDSLMQMGRWFGYRPGYVDLCRLYVTPELELWFRHVATAAEELRSRLDHMAMMGSTPEDYGLRIQSHDILMVTAPNKMRFAREFQVSFQGEAKIQTVFFREEAPHAANAAAVVGFLRKLGAASEPAGAGPAETGRRIWRGVAGAEVASLFSALRFPEEARDVNAQRLASYVRAQLPQKELTDWTVAVLAGDGDEASFDGWTFKTVERKPEPRSERLGRYVIKTLLSPADEALDLSPDEVADALADTNAKRKAKSGEADLPNVTRPDGLEIRRVRGRDPRRALLLIYPLSPGTAQLDFKIPVFGIVASFPDSKTSRSIRYRFNTVEQRLEPA